MNITLLIPIFNPEKVELNYWIKFYKKYKNDMKIHFLCDGPNSSIVEKLYKVINAEDLFVNEYNKGKFKTIYDHIKLNKIETSHIKICDPDDLISFDSIPKEDLNVNMIYTHRIKYLVKRPILTTNYKMKKLSRASSNVTSHSFANNCTIYPVKFILKDTFFSGIRIDASDDKLLGYICLFNGALLSRLDNSFYFYINGNGNTNLSKFDQYLEKAIITFEEILRISKLNNIPIPIEQNYTIKWFERKMNEFCKFKKCDKFTKNIFKKLMLILNELDTKK